VLDIAANFSGNIFGYQFAGLSAVLLANLKRLAPPSALIYGLRATSRNFHKNNIRHSSWFA